MRIWLIPFNKKMKYISHDEELIAKKLPPNRGNSYRFSRGYLRFCLSKVFNISPKEVPLHALPGKPPLIPKEYGIVSMSHCSDALLIGLASKKIGVDIENINRPINIDRFIKSKFLSQKEKLQIKNLKRDYQLKEFLKIWVLKEAVIKFSLGSIINDFNKWELIDENKTAKNLLFDLQINILNKNIKNWSLGLACEEKIIDSPSIVEFLY